MSQSLCTTDSYILAIKPLMEVILDREPEDIDPSIILALVTHYERTLFYLKTFCIDMISRTQHNQSKSGTIKVKISTIFLILNTVAEHSYYIHDEVHEIIALLAARANLFMAVSSNKEANETLKILTLMRHLNRQKCFGNKSHIFCVYLSEIMKCLFEISSNVQLECANELRYQAASLISEILNVAPAQKYSILDNYMNENVFDDRIDSYDPSSLVERAIDSLSFHQLSSRPSDLFWFCHPEIELMSAVFVFDSILFSKRSYREPWKPDIVLTESSIYNLRTLAQHIKSSRPILLCGDIGCGKSFFLRQLADACGVLSTMIELYLDEQSDAKSLIGAYVSSSIPGEFVWKNGVITQAVMQGLWLVIENIDSAPLSIVSSMVELLESRCLTIPGIQGVVKAHPNFRIFATTSYRSTSSLNNSSDTMLTSGYLPNLRHLNHMWRTFDLQSPNCEEIKLIIQRKYPSLVEAVVEGIMNVYNLFCERIGATEDVKEKNSFQRVRLFSLRDIIRICNRVSENLSSSFNSVSQMLTHDQRYICFSECVDVFAEAIRDRTIFAWVIKSLSACWNIPSDDCLTLVVHKYPKIIRVNSSLSIGRALFNVIEREISDQKSQDYAYTAYSARILEKLAVCVLNNEPVLLVGETGAGKTSSIQELAQLLHRKLVVQNLSLSTDSNDLFGCFRPASIKQILRPIYEDFVQLFQITFSTSSNTDYLQVVAQCYRVQQWKKLLKSFAKAAVKAKAKLEQSTSSNQSKSDIIDEKMILSLQDRWKQLHDTVNKYDLALPKMQQGFAFSFEHGLLVDAMRQGHWILLDEINLASSETLQGLAGILEGQSFTLTEKGDLETITRHPSFRIFAAMNPPTDVGKRELPTMLRVRFTEIYVEEMTEPDDLRKIVNRYITDMPNSLVEAAVNTYLLSRTYSDTRLVDTNGKKPKYSLRSLTRSLLVARNLYSLGLRGMNRAILEGFLLNFFTQIAEGAQRDFFLKFLMKSLNASENLKELSMPMSRPKSYSSDECVLIKPFWLKVGKYPTSDWSKKDQNGFVKYVMTPSIEQYIRNICAAVVSNVAPILLEGPTSVGKTTMIEYLAAKTGHKCIRINNHEHTDISEYVGGYGVDQNGHISFRDGSLVEALKEGHWIILDELNLAPSDVLEALNRLLDDNRELYIAETGETVVPAPSFRLFATQNPAGLYGGRKPLSRAFRNRFIEIAIDDLPLSEMEDIIGLSCGIPNKYVKMLTQTMSQLHMKRQASSIFQGKNGTVTLRDLLKWAKRSPQSPSQVAEEGYMIIAEKLRTAIEKDTVMTILSSVCGVTVDGPALYESQSDESKILISVSNEILDDTDSKASILAATKSMRRIWKLAYRGLARNEPILLVGGTGTGKTSLCQFYSLHVKQPIFIVNCHQSIESSDIIGGLRPVRGRTEIAKKIVSTFSSIHDSFPSMFASNNVLSELHNKFTVQSRDSEWIGEIKSAIDELTCVSKAMNRDEDEERASKKMRVETNQNLDNLANMTLDNHIKMLEDLLLRYQSIFEWQDGPLVTAMKCGGVFVLDEINLADDAVLERLNSVLESGRELTLAEKGSNSSNQSNMSEKILAHPDFKFLATMNPGGDFGKRELSPALRSRFTEIWVPEFTLDDQDDVILLLTSKLQIKSFDVAISGDSLPRKLAGSMLQFMRDMKAICSRYSLPLTLVSVRDLVSWADFVNLSHPSSLEQLYRALFHGAFLLFFDGLGVGVSFDEHNLKVVKIVCIAALVAQFPEEFRYISNDCQLNTTSAPIISNEKYSLNDFSVELGKYSTISADYITSAANTRENLYRLLRALQLRRPILLEGAPGVGKTSVIATLAAATGHRLVRINLSEQTEISDLLGSDLPAAQTGESNSKFNWVDGVFLKAMKNGDWVLLDEMNLAPQSVLEGLNSCFDHREEVFLPDICQVVHMAPSFRIFCAQNPLAGGGGRKGLPQSLLSRFSRVHIESISVDDMLYISLETSRLKLGDTPLLRMLEPYLPRMVALFEKLKSDIIENRLYGDQGAPWEFNLRDIFRWINLIQQIYEFLSERGAHSIDSIKNIVSEAAGCVVLQRFRTKNDRNAFRQVFREIIGEELHLNSIPAISRHFHTSDEVSNCSVQIGLSSLSVIPSSASFDVHSLSSTYSSTKDDIIGRSKKISESIAHCISLNWPVLLVGPYGSGKKRIIRNLAHESGNQLLELSASQSTDITDLIGSYEQLNNTRKLSKLSHDLERVTLSIVSDLISDSKLRSSHERIRSFLQQINAMNLLLQQLQEGKTSSEVNDFSLRDKLAEITKTIDVYVSYHLPKYGEKVKRVLDDLSKMEFSSDAMFEWVNGVVVQAVQQGHWLLIDNVNFCSSSVLDRLNSLLEPNGTLLLAENGSGLEISPHPNFRIFFSMVPMHGEVSRAMRNRCVEIFVFPLDIKETTVYHHITQNADINSKCMALEKSLGKINSDRKSSPKSYADAESPIHKLFQYQNQFESLQASRNLTSIDIRSSICSKVELFDLVHMFGLNVFVQIFLYQCIQLRRPDDKLCWPQVILTCALKESLDMNSSSFGRTVPLLKDTITGMSIREMVNEEEIVSESIRYIFGRKHYNSSNILQSVYGRKGFDIYSQHMKYIGQCLRDIGIDSNSKQYAAPIEDILHVFYFRRVNTIAYELQRQREFDRNTIQSDSYDNMNGWIFGFAAMRGKMHPSSREELMTVTLFNYMMSLESIAIDMARVIGQWRYDDSNISKIYQICSRCLELRDLLSSQLLCTLGPSFDVHWEEVSVIIRWSSKLFQKGLILSKQHNMGSIKDIFSHGLSCIQRVQDASSNYWNHHSLGMTNLILYKLTGAISIPRKALDWKILADINNIINDFDQNRTISDTYPSMYETIADAFPASNLVFDIRSKQQDICYDAIGLLCTYYWICTEEFGSSKPPSHDPERLSLTELMLKLRLKISKHRDHHIKFAENISNIDDVITIGNFAQLYMLQVDQMIHNHVTRLGEYTVVQLLQLIIHELSQLLFEFPSRSIPNQFVSNGTMESWKRIAKLSKICFEIVVEQSRFPLMFCRPLQALKWKIDALIASGMDQNQHLETLRLSASVIMQLNICLYNATQYSSFNQIFHSKLPYEISVISIHRMDQKQERMEKPSDSFLEMLRQGIATSHPVGLIHILDHLDSKMIFPQWKLIDNLRMISKTAIITNIWSYEPSKRIHEQLFQQLLLLSGTHNPNEMNSSSRTYKDYYRSRFYMVGNLLRMILSSFRGSISADESLDISTNCDENIFHGDNYELLFTSLLKKCNQSDSPSNRIIVEALLAPLMRIVTSDEFKQNPMQDMKQCGTVLIYSALAYIRLLIPSCPADPAMLAQVKRKFYGMERHQLLRILTLKTLSSSMIGESIVTDDVMALSDVINDKDNKIDKLQHKIIERSDDAKPYLDLYLQLLSLLSDNLNLERIQRRVDENPETKNDLDLFLQQEISFQNSLSSIVERLSDYSEYNDIVTPILSCLQLISQGFQMISQYQIERYLNRFDSRQVSVYQSFIYPFAANHSVKSTSSIISSSIENIAFFATKSEMITHICQANQSNQSKDMIMKEQSALNAFAFTALSSIEYWFSNGLVNYQSVRDTFTNILKYLSESFIFAAREKIKRKLEEDAAFKYKTDTTIFEANDELEEERAIKERFPDYLESFSRLTLSNEDAMTEDMNISVNMSDAALSLDLFDDQTCITILGYHSRMIFHHRSLERTKTGNIWRYFDSKDSKKNEIVKQTSLMDNMKDFSRNQMLKYVSIVGKTFSKELFSHTVDDLSSDSHGLSLALISKDLNGSLNYSVSNDDFDKDLQLIMYEKVGILHDFQTGCNISESIKIREPLLELLNRVYDILVTYPENEILRQICKLAATLLNFHVTTPLGKLLTGIHLLLRKAQDWESFASRDLSIDSYIAKLKAIVGQWRELELSSWETLLRSKEELHCLAASKSWFQIKKLVDEIPSSVVYDLSNKEKNKKDDAIHQKTPLWMYHGAAKKSDVTASDDAVFESQVLQRIYQVVDEYLRESIVGEFPIKLHIIRTFALQMLFDSEIDNCKIKYVIGTVFSGLWHYYRYFSSVIESYRNSKSSPIKQKILEEIKMGKWDKLTTYAAIEHSDRVHRKLFRFLRSYEEDALNVNIDTIIREETLKDLLENNQGVASEIPHSRNLFPLIQDPNNKETDLETVTAALLEVKRMPSEVLKKEIETQPFIESKRAIFKRRIHLIDKCDRYIQLLTSYDDDQTYPPNKSLRYGLVGSKLAESICSNVFDRIEDLRSESTTKPMKHRAIQDLFDALKTQGISHYKATAPLQLRSMALYSAASMAPFSEEILVDLSKGKDTDIIMTKGERYFHRNLLEMSQLRDYISQRKTSNDLSDREVETLIAFLENMSLESLRMRSVLAGALSDLKTFTHHMIALKTLAKAESKVNVDRIKESADYLHQSRLILSSFLQETLELFRSSQNVSKSSQDAIRMEHREDKDWTIVDSFLNEFLADIQNILIENSVTGDSVQIFGFCSAQDTMRLLDINRCRLQVQKWLETMQNNFKKLEDCQTLLGSFVSFDIANKLRSLMSEIIQSTKEMSLHLENPSDNSMEKIHDGEEESTAADDSSYDKCVDSCLVTIQKLNKIALWCEKADDSSENLFGVFEQPLMPITEETNLMQCVNISQLAVASIDLRKISRIMSSLVSSDDNIVHQSQQIQTILPILQQIMSVLNVFLGDISHAYKSFNKLLYVLIRVARSLVSKGFCHPDKTDDKEMEGGEGGGPTKFEDDVEGTGMGSGEGKKDVSDQIETEDQLLGEKNGKEKEEIDNKDQKDDSKPLSKEESEKGVEMSQDFEGDVHDLEDEEKEDQSAEDDGESIDREMGEADDEDVVDEKQWDKEDELDDAEMKNDRKTKGERLDEMETRDDESAKGEDSESVADQKENLETNKAEEGPNDESEINEDNGSDDDQRDDFLKEPEYEKGEEDAEADDVGDSNDLKDDGEDIPGQMDEPTEELPDEMAFDADDEEKENPDESNADLSNEMDTEQHDNDENNDEKDHLDDDQKPDDQIKSSETANEAENTAKDAFGVKGESSQGGNNDLDEKSNGMEGHPDNQESNNNQRMEDDQTGSGGFGHSKSKKQSSVDRKDEQKSKKNAKDMPNPLTERGDVMEKWHRRLDIVETQDEADDSFDDEDNRQENLSEEEKEGKSFGKGQSDDKDQVLGTVSEDNKVPLPMDSEIEQSKQENDPNDDNSSPDAAKSDEKPIDPMEEDQNEAPNENSSKKRKRNRKDESIQEKKRITTQPDNEREISEEESLMDENRLEEVDMIDESNEVIINPLSVVNYERFSQEKDQFPSENLQDSQREILPSQMDPNRSLWHHHRRLTDSHSLKLCEDLRLLLEPTLAVRLRGDYRTGKRINMRKIVQYIASGYRKDKIWLRRTKPAKRDYRVLLMIDNSKSMGAAGPLALSALTTMAMALSKLEVGDLCIARFAESVQVVHPFGQMFDDESGSRLVSVFDFNDNMTRLGQAVTTAGEIFSSNEGSPSTSLQLCFIVSDARIDTDDRSHLKGLLANLAEKNILVVLVIVDLNADSKDSILNTRLVEFREGKIVTSSYLDDFPFPLYVVVQSLEMLPQILTEALRQWFESAAQEI